MGTDPVCQEQIVLDYSIIHILQTDAETAGSMVVGDGVVGEFQATAVHHECAHRVVSQEVVGDGGIITIHEMESIATLGDGVVANSQVFGIPKDNIATFYHLVLCDEHIVAEPDPDRITTTCKT